jgi:broad specificity phosphatase PhoE
VTVTLLRHYKVRHTRQRRYTPNGYIAAMKDYDDADVANQQIELPFKYQRIITSRMKRARQTFEFIFNHKEHEKTELLNEVPMMPFSEKNKEYSTTFLDVMARIQWMLNSEKQPETKKMTIARANEFIDKYLRDCMSCLIVGHGFFLRVLSKEMRKRNFKGKEIVYIRNGEYYTYDNDKA